MRSYVFSILSAALLATMAERLAPHGEGGRLSASVRMVAGLFILLTLLSPVKEGIRLLREAAEGELTARVEAMLPTEGNDYAALFEDTLTGLGEGEITACVTAAMEESFGVPPSGCRVWVDCNYGEGVLTVSEIRICLTGKYLLVDPHPVEAYFGELFGCPCYVTVEG